MTATIASTNPTRFWTVQATTSATSLLSSAAAVFQNGEIRNETPSFPRRMPLNSRMSASSIPPVASLRVQAARVIESAR